VCFASHLLWPGNEIWSTALDGEEALILKSTPANVPGTGCNA